MLVFTAGSADAELFMKFSNRWHPNKYIHTEHGPPAAGPAGPGWWSAMWQIEHTNDGYIRLRNRWRGGYLHVENGPLELGPVEPGWWSAMWTAEPAEHPFIRLKNRWRGGYLHIESGQLEHGAIQPGWWSAMWRTDHVESAPPVPEPPAASETLSLLAPQAGAAMDNGCSSHQKEMEWNFQWSPVAGASLYQIMVMGPNARNPLVNTAVTSNFHRHSGRGYVADHNRTGWTWRVRAQVNGQWGPWSESSFNVEPLDTDCR
jgi:hypothetical protein